MAHEVSFINKAKSSLLVDILAQRIAIKDKTIKLKKQLHQQHKGQKQTLFFYALCPKYSDDVQHVLL